MEKWSLLDRSDYDEVFQLLRACAAYLVEQKIDQWDETYPNPDIVNHDLTHSQVIGVHMNNKLVGLVVVDEYQAPQYASIPWKYQTDRVAVIHRLAVDPTIQGIGLGKKIMRKSELFCKEKGYHSIRLDAYKYNLGLQKFYLNLDFKAAGEIGLLYTAGPFVCFEKSLMDEMVL